MLPLNATKIVMLGLSLKNLSFGGSIRHRKAQSSQPIHLLRRQPLEGPNSVGYHSPLRASRPWHSPVKFLGIDPHNAILNRQHVPLQNLTRRRFNRNLRHVINFSFDPNTASFKISQGQDVVGRVPHVEAITMHLRTKVTGNCERREHTLVAAPPLHELR